MKKFVWVAVAIVVTIYLANRICSLQMTKDKLPAQAMDAATRVLLTATTETPVPTATIGYMETALVAQATADEARRINAQATAAHESVLLAQSQLTAQAELIALSQLQLTAIVERMTATAALTSVPLTATQQVYANTAAAAQQRLQAAQLTATHQAPTQIVAMERSILYAKYGAVDFFARWFGIVAIGIFTIGIVAFVFTHPMQPKPVQEEQPTETVIWMKNERDAGARSTRYAVPCSPEQLTELSELVINGEKTFGINRLENNSRTLRRGVLYQVREWLTANNFAVDAGAGQIALNDDGEGFLVAWFDEHKLREGYEFAEVVDETA